MKKLIYPFNSAGWQEHHFRKLPSGFGSVRYLGEGRYNPYAVHPPESSAKQAKSLKRRPPALCYVRSRETGIKILAVYHSGLYQTGLENKPDDLNHLYKNVTGLDDGQEIRGGVVILWKGAFRFMECPDRQRRNPLLPLEKSAENADHKAKNTEDEAVNPVYDAHNPEFERDKYAGHRTGKDTDDNADKLDPKSTDHNTDKSAGENAANTGKFNIEIFNNDRSFKNENPQFSLEAEKPEAVEALYGRLYSLQAYIRNLIEDIDRIKVDHIDTPDLNDLQIGSRPVFTPKTVHQDNAPTLSTVYSAFYNFKYGPQAARQLTKSSRNATAAAYKKLARFHDSPLDDISVVEWQKLVNETAASGHSKSTVTDLVTLIRQLYRFAFPREMCTREYGKYIVMPYTSEESHHQDFTDAELKKLWKNKTDPVARMILIMCYSGFRIGEFETLQVVLDKNGRTGYFYGGIKTRAGKNRIVPVHSAIMPLLRQILDSNGQPVFLCGKSSRRFREIMKQSLVRFGIDTRPVSGTAGGSDKHGSGNLSGTAGGSDEHGSGNLSGAAGGSGEHGPGSLSGTAGGSEENKQTEEVRYHTPHSSRHTFSRLCESYGVNEADRKRMLGHSLGSDITNGVYGHRSVKELRAEIEKIKVPREFLK